MGKSAGMPSYNGKLTQWEISAAGSYLSDLRWDAQKEAGRKPPTGTPLSEEEGGRRWRSDYDTYGPVYDTLSAGKALYARWGCAQCHGKTGRGDGPLARSLTPRPTSFAAAVFLPKPMEEREVARDLTFLTMKEGGRAVGKSAAMPAFKRKIDDDLIDDLIEYVWSINRDAVGPKADPVIARFADAVNRRNWARALACADPMELQLMGLTRANAPAYFRACAEWTGGEFRLVFRERSAFNPSQGRYNRSGTYSVCDAHGKPRQSAEGYPARVHVLAYRTPRGWRIGVSGFARSLLSCSRPLDREHANVRRQEYIRVCKSVGVRTWCFSGHDGTWSDVAAPRVTVKPPSPITTAELKKRLGKK